MLVVAAAVVMEPPPMYHEVEMVAQVVVVAERREVGMVALLYRLQAVLLMVAMRMQTEQAA